MPPKKGVKKKKTIKKKLIIVNNTSIKNKNGNIGNINTPIFKDKHEIKECNEEKILKDELNEKRKELLNKKTECENELYKYIFKFFNNNQTIEDLIKSLYDFYKHKKEKDNSFIITMNEFINLFPRDTTQKGYNFKRQHVFEQLCRIILLLNYDNDYFGKNKIFYNSLEDHSKGFGKSLTKEEILKSKINDGSSAQSVDIFFKISKKIDKDKDKDSAACENIIKNENNTNNEKDTYILIQNKLYSQEYSSADKYDVTKIANRALELLKTDINKIDYKIVLMVNDKQSLDDKIKRNRNNDFGLVSEIFGLQELEEWFQNMMFDIYKSKSFEEFIKLENKSNKSFLQLRFHQELIVNSSYLYLHNETQTEQRKKFIWGCVPRSGKSYMVAGMVYKRLLQDNNENDILLILGAKSETEGQFIDMFKNYSNFNDYGIVTTKSDMEKETQNGKTKFIFILSQEKIKVNKNGSNFNQKFLDDYKKLFEKKSIDLYFDEIHKGGSTEKSQNKIINALLQNDIKIDLFVMVTATYARPSIAYETMITDKPPIILNWSYEDQQNMKQISNNTILQSFKDDRNTDIERKVINDLLLDYEGKYGKDFIQTLEEYYKKYPELVIIQPYNDLNEEPFDLHGNVFKLKCSAIGKNKEELKDTNKIFEDNNSVIKLLNFIGKEENNYLNPETVYGKLKHKYDYDVVNKRHSQLWFLPYSNLYTDTTDCNPSIKKDFLKDNITGYENDLVIQEENSDKIQSHNGNDIDNTEEFINQNNEKEKEEKDKKNLPNIEPLTRGLVLNMLNIPFYKTHFCFLIVHNQNTYDYYGKTIKNELLYNTDACVKYTVTDKRHSVKDIIHVFENQTYKEGKSLIILTGSMLRLGVSLPCADIAFNFDNIMSIDFNYQTMFRVLTERENKKYGYYLDFYPNRSIQFLYQYNEVYGSGIKKSKNMEELVTKLQSLLYLFNYNGLSITKIDEKQTLNLYNLLIENLQLTKENYSSRYISNGISTIKNILLSQNNKELLNELKNIVFENYDKPKKTKKTKVKTGIPKERAFYEDKQKQDVENNNTIQQENEDEIEEDEDYDINKLSDILFTFTSIIALFSNNSNYNCNDLNNCINNIIDNVNNIKELKNFCDCNKDNIDVLGCYLKRINETYTLNDYKKSLNIIKNVINNDNYSIINNMLIIMFDNIKEQLGMKTDLIYNMNSDDILEKIKEYLPVRKIEKDKYGEVFTPPELINEMFDQLPKEVWSNPDLKWLDPANGIGNFPMIAFERLNKGLEKKIPDIKKRKEHIVKNMLYMVELNEKNVGISKKIFSKDANIYCGSFLEDGWKKAFGIDKFDVIMGNPPFQKERTTDSGTTAGRKVLWNKFIDNSIDILSLKGLLTFINPSNWRGLGELHYLWDKLTSLQILYLHIYSKKAGQQLFDVSSRFDIYVLENTPITKPTKVIDVMGQEHHIQLTDWSFLPNYDYATIKKILTTEDKGIDVIHNSYYQASKFLKEKKTNKCNLPVIHTITQSGIGIRYACDKKGHFGVPKVILNFNEHQYSHKEQNDYEGKYGMSEISFGIPIKSKKEGDEILKAIDTNVFKTIIAATKWGAFQTDYRMFKYFRPDWYKIVLELDKQTNKSNKQNKTKKHKPSLNSKTSPNKTRKSNSSSSSKSGSSNKSFKMNGGKKYRTIKKRK